MRKTFLLLAVLASANGFAAAPSQFMAKLYSEALGRAPDLSAWKNSLAAGSSATCDASMLQSMAVNVFGSAEYTAKGYTAEEQALTLFRAILSREPDKGGFDFWVNNLRNGMSAAQVVPHLVMAQEFMALVPEMCSGKGYRADGAGKQAIDIGGGTWTQAQLESCIANNAVCSVPARTVVYLASTLTIPEGKVLETAGGYDRSMYARQARLVRNSATPGHLVILKAGATIRNIWVSGQRHLYKGELVALADAQANVFPNINYVGGPGTGVIRGVRSDAPLTATHIATFPVPTPAVPTSPTAFLGNVIIDNNLTTGYAHAHTYTAQETADNRPVVWADGISHHITQGQITNNHIIDPTDVGIVIFGHDGSTQASTAQLNYIVHAGLDAYGSLGLDTIQCIGSYTGCKFSSPNGVGNFKYNYILAAPLVHSDIMLFNGTGAWATPQCKGLSGDRCGTGGRMDSNITVSHVPVLVQIGSQVDGMKDAVMNNVLDVTQVKGTATYPNTWRMDCAKPGGLNVSGMTPPAGGASHSSTWLPSGVDAHSDGCIGH